MVLQCPGLISPRTTSWLHELTPGGVRIFYRKVMASITAKLCAAEFYFKLGASVCWRWHCGRSMFECAVSGNGVSNRLWPACFQIQLLQAMLGWLKFSAGVCSVAKGEGYGDE